MEILEASKIRTEILQTGTKLYMPEHEVIENCVDKGKSYRIWKREGLSVPNTMLINNEKDLKKAPWR